MTATIQPTFQLGSRQRKMWDTLTDAQRAVANASSARTASAALAEAAASPANPPAFSHDAALCSVKGCQLGATA